ncbi:uncharacterized protein BDZ99DRAFT_468486 [Mytilinidion resinicola]|uniref:Uncharacterized protein n=1 Tax=Mytilinidion resinicola TaxID=574789 RepID=A0A6A6Y5T7_9PEZI|nr:uncharacterized protein BDZ99DRAFT_468486 [Mytilinidion resinicola]KAF2803147.1 hypothetical protein BDZ99DRAFT_468486 [Mytilinidion resinicola]
MAPAATDFEEVDPVIAEYDVFLTPDLEEETYLLQYLNRAKEQPYNERHDMCPLELRMKQESGFIEVDVPVNVHMNFNRLNGVKWGESLRKAKEDGQTAFGVTAGFERPQVRTGLARGGLARGGARGGGTARGRTATAEPAKEKKDDDEDEELKELLYRFDDANEKGHVLNKQTLGGQILKQEEGEPKYMVGAFRGKELHLTKLSGIVQMRPQFHHLDALMQQEQAARRAESDAANPNKQSGPRAVQIQLKNSDLENKDMASTKQLLKAAAEEKWMKLRYHDEDSAEAYSAYREKLFVQDIKAAPKLHSVMNNEEYLEIISAPRVDHTDKNSKKKPLTRKQMNALELSDTEDEEEGQDEEMAEETQAPNDAPVDSMDIDATDVDTTEVSNEINDLLTASQS